MEYCVVPGLVRCLAPEVLFSHSSVCQYFRVWFIIPFLCHRVKICEKVLACVQRPRRPYQTLRIVAQPASTAAHRPPAGGPWYRLSASSTLAPMSGWRSADPGDHHPGSCSGPLEDGVQIHLISVSLPRCWLTLTLQSPSSRCAHR